MNNLKETLKDIINELKDGDILMIHYEGFIGRGINGASNNVAYISKNQNDKVIEWQDFYSTKLKKVYVSHTLLADCIKISSNDIDICRDKISKKSTVYIPYNMITSFEIMHKI